MPDYFQSSPWQQNAQAISGLGDTLQNVVLGLAQQKMMQQRYAQQQAMQERQMRLEENQARQRSALMGAQMKLDETKTKDLERVAGNEQALADAAWMLGMVKAGENQGVDMGPRGNIATARMMGAMGNLPDAQRSRLPENMAQMLQMHDPRFQQLLATGTKATATVGPGSTLVDTVNNQPVFESLRSLPPGYSLVKPEAGAQGLPQQLRGQAGQQLSKNNALTAVMSPTFQTLDAPIQKLVYDALTNAPTANTVSQPVNKPRLVRTKEEFDALPSGTEYMEDDGKIYRKP